MASERFEVLILNGRPAAGKSEIIDFLKKIPVDERLRRFHVGEFEEFDDFPILWERFEDDDLWEKNGKPRLISETHFEYQGARHQGYVFKDPFFWHWLLQKRGQHVEMLFSRVLRKGTCPDTCAVRSWKHTSFLNCAARGFTTSWRTSPTPLSHRRSAR